MAKSLPDLPAHFLAHIFSCLDTKAKSRAAQTCKTFHAIIFESHKTTLWKRMEMNLTSRGASQKSLDFFRKISDGIKSLDVSFTSVRVLQNLPEFPTVVDLTLVNRVNFEIFPVAVLQQGALSAKFPALQSLMLQGGELRDGEISGFLREFPTLRSFGIAESGWKITDEMPMESLIDVVEAFDALVSLKIARVRFVDVSGPVFDIISASERLAPQIVDLLIDITNPDDAAFYPQTLLGNFSSLKSLSLQLSYIEMDPNWLASLSGVTSLKKLRVNVPSAILSRFYRFNGPECLPPALDTLQIMFPEMPDAHGPGLMECIAQRCESGSLTSVALHGPMLLHAIYEPITRLLSAGVASLHISGGVKQSCNSAQELARIYAFMHENAESLKHLQNLSLSITRYGDYGNEEPFDDTDDLDIAGLEERLNSVPGRESEVNININ